MAESRNFQVSVVTPERAVFEGEARFVALPAWDGEMGVLRHRAPILVKLDAGRLRIDAADKGDSETDELVYFIDGGFGEMVGDQLTILTEEARTPDELDREKAEALLSEAHEMTGGSAAEVAARDHAFRKARTQLRMLTGK